MLIETRFLRANERALGKLCHLASECYLLLIETTPDDFYIWSKCVAQYCFCYSRP